MERVTLHHGDCIAVLKAMPDASVDSVVTDPPYGLSFMGKRWDYDVPSVDIWAECLRVLKPGGHLLAFAGTRTQHRMAVRIEDAGFEIRDMIAWVYGSGFPKSYNVSKGIEGKLTTGSASWNNWRDLNGEDRECSSGPGGLETTQAEQGHRPSNYGVRPTKILEPTTEAAKQWQGWGTALKPSLEPITVARKPLSGTVAENVLAHGTGALNIDGCRVEGADAQEGRTQHGGGVVGNASSYELPDYKAPMPSGRWPANLIHDGGDEVTSLLGDAARFFYCPKASKKDRDAGLESLKLIGPGRTCYDPQYHEGGGKLPPRTGNFHPTVKPTELMRYLCRLVTPPGGLVLDPFMGSGSTGKAAVAEGFKFIGIEREADYVEIANARINNSNSEPLFI